MSLLPRLYFDTSVVGGWHDREFEEATQRLFQQAREGQWQVIVSDLTLREIDDAGPEAARRLLIPLGELSFEQLPLAAEAEDLADAYIAEGILLPQHRNDALHIALATVYRADMLVSWNFKHMVNVWRNRCYNAVNLKLGYPMIEIRSPMEVLRYEQGD